MYWLVKEGLSYSWSQLVVDLTCATALLLDRRDLPRLHSLEVMRWSTGFSCVSKA